jgi:hypothetical protein
VLKLTPKQVTDLLKRFGDASEKFAIASLAIGAWEGNLAAALIGLAFFSICITLTTIGGAR